MHIHVIPLFHSNNHLCLCTNEQYVKLDESQKKGHGNEDYAKGMLLCSLQPIKQDFILKFN